MTKEGGKYQEMVKSQQMEKIHDAKGGILPMEKVLEEDQKQICMLTR
jgi:hypothetical protein